MHILKIYAITVCDFQRTAKTKIIQMIAEVGV